MHTHTCISAHMHCPETHTTVCSVTHTEIGARLNNFNLLIRWKIWTALKSSEVYHSYVSILAFPSSSSSSGCCRFPLASFLPVLSYFPLLIPLSSRSDITLPPPSAVFFPPIFLNHSSYLQSCRVNSTLQHSLLWFGLSDILLPGSLMFFYETAHYITASERGTLPCLLYCNVNKLTAVQYKHHVFFE